MSENVGKFLAQCRKIFGKMVKNDDFRDYKPIKINGFLSNVGNVGKKTTYTHLEKLLKMDF